MNEVTNLDITNPLNGLSTDQLFAALLQKMNTTIEETRAETKNNTNEILKLDEKVNSSLQMNQAKAHLTDSFEGYMNQTEFGNQYFCKISSVQIGWLLQMCGVAMKSNGNFPYDDIKISKYWKAKVCLDKYANERIQYLWNYKNCSAEIDTWLKKHHLFVTFYSCSTHKSLKEYITAIHNNWLNGEYR